MMVSFKLYVLESTITVVSVKLLSVNKVSAPLTDCLKVRLIASSAILRVCGYVTVFPVKVVGVSSAITSSVFLYDMLFNTVFILKL